MDDGGSQAGPTPAPVRAPTVGGLDWAIIVFYLVLSVSLLAVSVLGDVTHSPVRLSLGRDALVTVTMHVLFLTAEIPRAPWRY